MTGIGLAIATRLALVVIYGGALLLSIVLAPLGRVVRGLGDGRTSRPAQRYKLMVLGTFYTRNWCVSHLTPLGRAWSVESVTAVVDGPTCSIQRVNYAHPARCIVRLAGRAVAKLLCALRCAFRDPPDLVMGYHLLPGALLALLAARAVGAKAAYQVTGGPIQLIGGGAGSENFFLKRLLVGSWLIERLAFALARRFDLIVVRGQKAQEFMTQRKLGQHVCVVPGSIDAERFKSRGEARHYDLVAISRLVEVKQPEHFLKIVERVRCRIPTVRTAIVGDGPLLETLKSAAGQLGIHDHLEFLGHVEDVESVLRRSKVFVLTSRSEGLSIALAEAMAAGAVPVVANVGDLSELVQDGVNGRLVAPGDFDQYANRICDLLSSADSLRAFSQSAQAAATKHNDVRHVADRWARVLTRVCGWPEWVNSPFQRRRRRRKLISLPSRWQIWDKLPAKTKGRLNRVLAQVPPERMLGSRFHATNRFLRGVEHWAPEVTNAFIVERLRRICTLAWRRTDYYGDVFRRAGFDPRELKSTDDLRCLPFIDKDTLREHLHRMCTVPPDSSGIDRVSTGGTSGVPLSFYIGTERSGIEYAYLVHAWSRVGYAPRLAQAVFRGRSCAQDASGLHHEYDPILRRHYYSTFHITDENLRRYLEHLATIGPCFLHVYPSSVDLLARFLKRTHLPVPRNIQGILAGSEMVYAEQRTRAERIFGVRYFSWYGHSEKLVFAAECEHSHDYHVYATYGYVELLDEDDRPVTTPGQRGEIVGTGFINTVVPFIRYRTGDYATFCGDRCEACGRRQMILRDIRGHRTQEMLVGKDGSQISWTALNMHDDTFDRVRRFQFVQSTPGHATLRLIPEPGFQQADRERILRNLQRKLAGSISIDIQLCEQIPLTRMGKMTYVDQRIEEAVVSPAGADQP